MIRGVTKYVHDKTRRKITYARILYLEWGPDIAMLTPAPKYLITGW